MMLPEETTLTLWANSLIIDFPYDNVPLLINESRWKEWGNELIGAHSFISNDVPTPNNYNDWQTWAYDVYFLMCNNVEQNAQ
jgi:hypothetical protein